MVQTSFFSKISVAGCVGLALSLSLSLTMGLLSSCSKDQTESPGEPVAGDVNEPASSDPTVIPEYVIQLDTTGTAEAPDTAVAPDAVKASDSIAAPAEPVKKVKTKKKQARAKFKSSPKTP